VRVACTVSREVLGSIVASDPIDLIAEKVLNFGYKVSLKTIDKGLLEICGPTGVSKTTLEFIQKMRMLQSGFIYHYAIIMILGLTICLSIVFFLPMWYTLIDTRVLFVQLVAFIFITIAN